MLKHGRSGETLRLRRLIAALLGRFGRGIQGGGGWGFNQPLSSSGAPQIFEKPFVIIITFAASLERVGRHLKLPEGGPRRVRSLLRGDGVREERFAAWRFQTWGSPVAGSSPPSN